MAEPFKIKTGDPAFDPRLQIEVNGYAYVPLKTHSERVKELLEANNRYLERAREAEGERENFRARLIEYQRACSSVSMVMNVMLGDIAWPNVARFDGSMPNEPFVIEPIVFPAAPAANSGGDHEVAAPTTEKAGTLPGSESGPGGYAEGGQN